MSLDITFYSQESQIVRCNCCGSEREQFEELHEQNITHNLIDMAEAIGVYKHVWRGFEIGVKTPQEMIEPIKDGIRLLQSNTDYYSQFNAQNGWGTVDQFIPWLQDLLSACHAFPDARIEWDI